MIALDRVEVDPGCGRYASVLHQLLTEFERVIREVGYVGIDVERAVGGGDAR